MIRRLTLALAVSVSLAGCLPGAGRDAPVAAAGVPEVETSALPPAAATGAAEVTGDPAAAGATDSAAAAPSPAPPDEPAADGGPPDAAATDAAATETTPADAAPAVEAVPPPPPPSPEALACQRSGGRYLSRGGGGNRSYCARQTRDGNKSCTSAGQCEGYCLARSGTCAPVTPVFGCQDILDDTGRRMTQCLD